VEALSRLALAEIVRANASGGPESLRQSIAGR